MRKLFRRFRKAETSGGDLPRRRTERKLSAARGREIAKALQIMAHLFAKPPPEVVRGQAFDVGPRYCGLAYIGEGAYGMVW